MLQKTILALLAVTVICLAGASRRHRTCCVPNTQIASQSDDSKEFGLHPMRLPVKTNDSLFLRISSLLFRVGNREGNRCGAGVSRAQHPKRPGFEEFPVKSCSQGNLRREGCDLHCVASHAVVFLENIPLR